MKQINVLKNIMKRW